GRVRPCWYRLADHSGQDRGHEGSGNRQGHGARYDAEQCGNDAVWGSHLCCGHRW
ncbi:hypothetical protein HOL46_02535, partial [Candidatus Falkowbacteria bacterium]|nr:hypothetical protein [Candidatus Falkowbacteria bacterium]